MENKFIKVSQKELMSFISNKNVSCTPVGDYHREYVLGGGYDMEYKDQSNFHKLIAYEKCGDGCYILRNEIK